MPSMSYALELDLNEVVTERDFDLVLHNMVAVHQPDVTSKDYIRSIERHLDESDDHELNERDSHGRTALHIAVLYRNVEAVAGLLMCGADVNVGDENGKTPFSYCLERYDVRNYECNQLFFVFLGHVHKLIEMGLHLGQENRRCYVKARARHVFNDNQLMQSYAVELDKMEDVRVGPHTSLRDVLYEGADELATSSTKRLVLEEVLTSRDFYDEFPKLCALLKLQYRRGLTRRKLMQPVKAMLQRIAGEYGLPDPCTETIIRHLHDEDLIMLTELHVQMLNERQGRVLQLAESGSVELLEEVEVEPVEIQNKGHEENVQES